MLSFEAMKLKILFAVIFLSAISVFSQTQQEEFKRLREVLSVPETTEITVASNSSLSAGKSFKIFIATGLDMIARENLRGWIAEWNKKKGKKYSMLEIVGVISEADIVLARYTLKDKPVTETESRVVTGTVFDPATNKVTARPVTKTDSYTQVPAYGYILERKSPGKFEIIWRYNSPTSIYETKETAKQLWLDLENLLKVSRN